MFKYSFQWLEGKLREQFSSKFFPHSPPSWSSNGCVVHHHDASRTQCHCYHMTSFAVLMDVHGAYVSYILHYKNRSISVSQSIRYDWDSYCYFPFFGIGIDTFTLTSLLRGGTGFKEKRKLTSKAMDHTAIHRSVQYRQRHQLKLINKIKIFFKTRKRYPVPLGSKHS